MTTTNIIIADDHPVFRIGLAHIINGSGEFRVVAEAESTVELIHALQSAPCHIVVLDMKMPENRDGLAALEIIKKTCPEVKVMIMSQMVSADLVDEAMKLGADGYVSKNDIADMILPFLKSIGKGETVLSPRIQSMILGLDNRKAEKLTPREHDILRLSVRGASRKEIAKTLNITVSTVNFHRQNIKDKLQADNLASLIRIAYDKGLV